VLLDHALLQLAVQRLGAAQRRGEAEHQGRAEGEQQQGHDVGQQECRPGARGSELDHQVVEREGEPEGAHREIDSRLAGVQAPPAQQYERGPVEGGRHREGVGHVHGRVEERLRKRPREHQRGGCRDGEEPLESGTAHAGVAVGPDGQREGEPVEGRVHDPLPGPVRDGEVAQPVVEAHDPPERRHDREPAIHRIASTPEPEPAAEERHDTAERRRELGEGRSLPEGGLVARPERRIGTDPERCELTVVVGVREEAHVHEVERPVEQRTREGEVERPVEVVRDGLCEAAAGSHRRAVHPDRGVHVHAGEVHRPGPARGAGSRELEPVPREAAGLGSPLAPAIRQCDLLPGLRRSGGRGSVVQQDRGAVEPEGPLRAAERLLGAGAEEEESEAGGGGAHACIVRRAVSSPPRTRTAEGRPVIA
jgi:hypothetical protein